MTAGHVVQITATNWRFMLHPDGETPAECITTTQQVEKMATFGTISGVFRQVDAHTWKRMA